MQKKENFNVSEVENDINSRNKIYLETNVIDIIPGKPGPTGEKGNDGDDGIMGLSGKDGLIGNSGNDGLDAATVKFIKPDGKEAGEVSVRNSNADDTHIIDIPEGKKGDRGDTRKLNFCYIYKNQDDTTYNKSDDSNCYLEDPSEEEDISKDMYLYIPKGNKGPPGDQGDCSMESPGFPGPPGDTGPDGDKGEKGPRGLEGKRGIDANYINTKNNITSVEYKICFDNSSENCIDLPKLKAINQDYQDKIDNKPYEDIISNKNDKYVPVLLRRINRLKKDLCLAHLIGDYSKRHLNDIKSDLDETYDVFNKNESEKFKEVYSDDNILEEYCFKFFNIVTQEFVFNKTEEPVCTNVDLYDFIEADLKDKSKWDNRNTFKNTPIIQITFDKNSRDIISDNIDKAALTIDIDKIFDIFPNIYEIKLIVNSYITGKHGSGGNEKDTWDGKDPVGLNGGNGQPGNDGGPGIEIKYQNPQKEILINIIEDNPERIIGGFGSLGGEGGKASKSFTVNYARYHNRGRNYGEICEETHTFDGPSNEVPGSGELKHNERAWVRGNGNSEMSDKYFDMIVFGRHHLISIDDNKHNDLITSTAGNNDYYWKFEIDKNNQIYAGGRKNREHSNNGWNNDFNCKTYDYRTNKYKSDVPQKFFSDGINYDDKKSELIRPNQYCGSRAPSSCKEFTGLCGNNNYSSPKDGASWFGFTAKKCKLGYSWQPCPPGHYIHSEEYCCPDKFKNTYCSEGIDFNTDGNKVPGEQGKPTTIVANKLFNASNKEKWDKDKQAARYNWDKDKDKDNVGFIDIKKYKEADILEIFDTYYMSMNMYQIASYTDEKNKGKPGEYGVDGKDGEKIKTTNIQDKSKVIIRLNGKDWIIN